MGSLSRLAKQCQECIHVDECKCKKMESVAYISGPIFADAFGQNVVIPNTVIIAQGANTKDIMESIEKEIAKSMSSNINYRG